MYCLLSNSPKNTNKNQSVTLSAHKNEELYKLLNQGITKIKYEECDRKKEVIEIRLSVTRKTCKNTYAGEESSKNYRLTEQIDTY